MKEPVKIQKIQKKHRLVESLPVDKMLDIWQHQNEAMIEVMNVTRRNRRDTTTNDEEQDEPL